MEFDGNIIRKQFVVGISKLKAQRKVVLTAPPEKQHKIRLSFIIFTLHRDLTIISPWFTETPETPDPMKISFENGFNSLWSLVKAIDNSSSMPM